MAKARRTGTDGPKPEGRVRTGVEKKKAAKKKAAKKKAAKRK